MSPTTTTSSSSTSIRTSASTAMPASRPARWTPASPRTSCPRSGSASPRSTRRTTPRADRKPVLSDRVSIESRSPTFEGERQMTTTDDVLRNAEQYASSFDQADLPMPPGRKLAVVACMDARLIPTKVLGLQEGDAHVIRNAGGVVTDDTIRSLAISQHKLGTQEIILIHHTDCGMLTFRDDDFREELEEQTGAKPSWAAESFTDLDRDLRQSMERIRNSPFIPSKNVRGFVYEVETGKLREVS